jgi:hypothetical protein
MRTLFTRPDTWVTIGCLILGSSIQSAQAQTRLNPSAAASANDPIARPALPLPTTKPASANAALRQRK